MAESPTARTYEVEALVTVTVDGDEYDARAAVDALLQDAWNHTQGGRTTHQPPWQFELLDGGLITDITEEEDR